MSDVCKGIPKTEETKFKMSLSWTDERKAKNRERMCGENNPMKKKEVAEKNVAARIGFKHTDETKSHLSEIKKGKKNSNIMGEKNGMYGKPSANKGKHHSDETRQKMKDAWAKRKLSQLELEKDNEF